MLRVGLTGGVGSGKSAVARVWAEAGVPVLEADALGRALMQPGQPVYAAIVATFGPQVVDPDGQLNRAALARAAFSGGRLDELNRLVHPAVLAGQARELDALARSGQHLLAVVESALIFEASGEAPGDGLRPGPGGTPDPASTARPAPPARPTAGDRPPMAEATAPGWRSRFDKLVLVAAPEPLRMERFALRVGGPGASEAEKGRLREDARRRIAAQLPEAWKRARCDYVVENDRTLVLLRREALRVLAALQADARRLSPTPGPL